MLYPKDREIQIEKSADSLRIEWNWKKNQGIGYLLLSFSLSILFWYMATAPNPKTGIKPDSSFVPMTILASIYVVPSFVWGLANLLNKTSIVATRENISMSVSPIPLAKTVVRSSLGVQQFFVRPSKTGKFSGWLYMMDKKSECSLITYRMPSSFAAFQICHELQDFYGLEDLPVYGQNTQPHQPGPRTSKR